MTIDYKDEIMLSEIKTYLNNYKFDKFVFSYGGCGTNYIRKLLNIWGNRVKQQIRNKKIKKIRYGLKKSIHVFSPPVVTNTFTAFYIFGDPYLTIQSIYRRKLCNITNILAGKILNSRRCEMSLDNYLNNGKDDLRLIEHFNNWFNAKTEYKIIFINYDKLFGNLDNLEKELNITFNARAKKMIRKRMSSINDFSEEQLQKLDDIYGNFRSKILKLPNYWIKEPL